MTTVFVYGTLKTGQPNHCRLSDPAHGHARFLASARTVERFPLVIAGPHHIPFLVRLPGEGRRVRGELYRVDGRMLDFLDAFEGVPDMYQRTALRVRVERRAEEGEGGAEEEEEEEEEGDEVEAQAYSAAAFEPGWAELPTHESYDAYGEHGLVYVEREARH